MKILVSADSSVDLTKELIEKYNITVAPLQVLLGDKNHSDGVDIAPKDIYEFVGKTNTLPKTAAVTEDYYTNMFSKMLENADHVIHFNISNEMSVTHTNACHAAESFNGKVTVIDSKTLSTGTALLALKTCEMIEENKELEQIKQEINNLVPKVQASFILDKLNYLHKGGRCSSVALLGANLLKIKPCIEVNDGKMGMARKYFGAFPKNVEKYVEDTLVKYPNYDDTRVFLTHTEIDPQIVESVKTILKEKANFKEILETTAGSTITSHCGSNTIGIIYITK